MGSKLHTGIPLQRKLIQFVVNFVLLLTRKEHPLVLERVHWVFYTSLEFNSKYGIKMPESSRHLVVKFRENIPMIL